MPALPLPSSPGFASPPTPLASLGWTARAARGGRSQGLRHVAIAAAERGLEAVWARAEPLPTGLRAQRGKAASRGASTREGARPGEGQEKAGIGGAGGQLAGRVRAWLFGPFLSWSAGASSGRRARDGARGFCPCRGERPDAGSPGRWRGPRLWSYIQALCRAKRTPDLSLEYPPITAARARFRPGLPPFWGIWKMGPLPRFPGRSPSPSPWRATGPGVL